MSLTIFGGPMERRIGYCHLQTRDLLQKHHILTPFACLQKKSGRIFPRFSKPYFTLQIEHSAGKSFSCFLCNSHTHFEPRIFTHSS